MQSEDKILQRKSIEQDKQIVQLSTKDLGETLNLIYEKDSRQHERKDVT